MSTYLASIDGESYPVMRAMLVLEHDSLKTQYFSTNTSSGKVSYYRNHPKASVYYCEPQNYKGVLFVGEMQLFSSFYNGTNSTKFTIEELGEQES